MYNMYVRSIFAKHEAQQICDDIASEEYGKFKRSRLYDTSDGKMIFKEMPNQRRSWEQIYHAHSRFAWIKQRVTNHVKEALDEFGMNIDDIAYPQGLRFIKYDASEHGFQDWHTDKSKPNRMLSCVIQLTDPATYQGGRLEFKSPMINQEVPVEQGSLIIFPSEQLHRVTECTHGTRYSLIVWADEKGLDLPQGFVEE